MVKHPPGPSSAKKAPRKQPKKKARDPQATPAMQQWSRFKKQHPDCVLLFRMGDFYELFNEDAVHVSKLLGLTLTQRSEGVPMAGVPAHALEAYLRRLVEHGQRVAICDQIQDPRDAKGVVDRAVTRLVTPGTLVDETLLDEAACNHVAAFILDPEPAVAIAELSTGRFQVAAQPELALLDVLVAMGPSELLYEDTLEEPPEIARRCAELTGCALTSRPAWSFAQSDARERLESHFGVNTLEGFGLSKGDIELSPAGGLLRYLQETQACDDQNSPSRLSHLQPPQRINDGTGLHIDAISIRSLEIERTLRSGQVDGSLLAALQSCTTPMGKRLFRQWLCFPLGDVETIESRQDIVQVFFDDRALANSLSKQIAPIQDVARIVGRIATRRATPRDLVALGQSISRLDGLIGPLDAAPALAPFQERLEKLSDQLRPLSRDIVEACVDSPPPHLRDGGLFRTGIDAALDEARTLQTDASGWLANYQASLIEETSIPSLKVGYNKVFGYYIEVTHLHTSNVPDHFSRKQTLKNAERYITPELKEFEEKILHAKTLSVEREQTLFEDFCHRAQDAAASISDFAVLVSEIDVLLCFAENAVAYKHVRPKISKEPVLSIEGGRHPVLDRMLRDGFVPNDTELGGAADLNSPPLGLITGPNMAGKSTYIRQVALLVLLAHTGSFIPAEKATIGLTDRIFTRIGASDELHAGASTFMVEMTETANILHHATDRSLVILDEIGRGTSTLDGLSLAWAITESLASIGCRTLFATHYHELTTLADTHANIKNLHVTVREWGDQIVFLHRVEPGRTDRSYGIHVARIAGVPKETLQRASELLDSLAVEHSSALPDRPNNDNEQLSLFASSTEHPAMQELRDLQLDTMTPMAAFDLLRKINSDINNTPPPSV
ncbi:MAG: DNA mismatch repair protein MutS [Phycisphaerales bacterium]|nr:DNA mismatch repair protein MutS [Phycisphaerales bacterium]